MKRPNDLWLIKNWKFVLVISFLLLLFPIVFYAFHFSSFKISDNPEHWGVFGDFVGGIINPIISILSLIVLGLLTWLVAKQSNEENYTLSLKRLRIDVIEEFSNSMMKIVGYETKIYRVALFVMKIHGKEINGSELGRILKSQFNDLERQTQSVLEAKIFFSHVFVTKNHLFKKNSIFKLSVQSIVDYDELCLQAMNKVKFI
ncbi:hypothetical protein [uncultured Croceitalea sp.]|uniref:hypothetical protein n=1 Tax=uncultured Croceitalea sp. TaxID=1798908 RepID=UPI00374F83F7